MAGCADDKVKADPITTKLVWYMENPHEQLPVYFMFPGQGSQYPNMARGLYLHFEEFRRPFDNCADILRPNLGRDLRVVVFPGSEASRSAAELLDQTELAQPALFSVGFAMARFWQSRGVQPSGMIGHSLGEFVAACLAGVFSLEDCLSLVCRRGQLMQSMPRGGMLAVALDVSAVLPYLNGDISIAAENGPTSSVLSGPIAALEELEAKLDHDGIAARRLQTSHAFHSAMMEPIVDCFVDAVKAVKRHPARLPYISNVTGMWIKPIEAADPDYWGRHIRLPVKFWSGLKTLTAERRGIFLEVGPGRTLTDLLRRVTAGQPGVLPIRSIRHPDESVDDVEFLSCSLAQTRTGGGPDDWTPADTRPGLPVDRFSIGAAATGRDRRRTG